MRGGGVLTQALHSWLVPFVLDREKKGEWPLPEPALLCSLTACFTTVELNLKRQKDFGVPQWEKAGGGKEQRQSEPGAALGWQDLNQRVPGLNHLSQGMQPDCWDSFALAMVRVVTAAL